MALTKVTGDFIKDGVLTQAHLHTSHGITTAHISEGSNLYFTNARVDSRIGSLSSSDLSEGTNLYYTDARARSAISVSGNALSYNSSTGVITSNFEESPTFSGNVIINGSGSSGNALNVTRGSDGTTALRVQNTGEVVTQANYFYASGPGVSMYVQNTAVFRGSILNDGSNADVRIADGLTVDDDLAVIGGNITLGGTGRIQGIDTVSANTDAANKLYVDNQVAGIVDSAPSTLDTLNELAAALGDDASFSTTVTNSIALKAPLASPTFTGTVTASGDPGLLVTASGTSTIHVASTGTGSAGVYMDASNGDFSGSDYVFIGQDNDKTFRLESFNSSGDILLRESNTNTLRLSSGNATFAGHVSATQFRPTNIVTNKVVKFNGTQLDDSIITDDGSTVTVAGTIAASGYNDSNWNTAYGWGNHASANYWVKSGSWYGDLGSHSYTRELGLGMTGGSEFVVLSKNGQGSVLVDGHYMAYESANGFFGSFNSTYGNLTGIRATAANTLKVMQLDGGNAILEVTQDARAPLFYDSNDTTYYLNPASGSNLFTLDLNAGTVWDATTQGTSKGALHLDPNSATDHAGAAITFGASDHNNGQSADAGIYIRSDGSYGTKMYFATTDSYATGSKTAMNILHNGQVNITRSNLVVNSDVRGTVFYDSNDTTYFLNPSSSGGNALKTIGDWRQTSDGWSGEVGGKMQYHGNHWYLQAAGYVHFRNASGTNTFYVDSNGVGFVHEYITGNTSLRAPIFYDSNDTTYYLNPASTSQVNTMEFVGSTNNGRFFGDTWGVKLQTDSGYILFGPANTSHAHIYTDRSNFYFNQQIQLNGGSLINTNDIRAGIFYDVNDTGYYVDPASKSFLSTIHFNGSVSGTGAGSEIGRNHAYDTMELKGYGAEFMIGAQSWEININYRTCNGGVSGHTPTTWKWRAGSSSNWSDHYMGLIQSSSSMRAPIFYNSSDTNSYLQAGTLVLRSGDPTIYMRDTNHRSVALHNNSNRFYVLGAPVDSTTYAQISGVWPWYVQLDTNDVYTGSIGYAGASYRAPVFYDRDDTGYYVNPNGTSNFLKIKSNQAQTSPRWDTAFYVLQAQHWYGDSSSQEMFIGESGNTINIRGSITAAGVIDCNAGHGAINITNSSILSSATSTWTGNPGGAGKIQYHSNRWYIVSDSSSNRIVQFRRDGGDVSYIDNSGRLIGAPDARAPIYYDSDNTNYYTNPTSTSVINGLTMAGALQTAGSHTVGSSGTSNIYMGGVSGNYFRFHTNNSHTYFDANVGDIHWRQGSSTRFTFYMTSANMTINGSLTQNSDERVKENIVEIPNAIDKVKALKGVYYNRTDFNTGVTKVGVLAQEVEAVLPELIVEAPDSGLKSVAYGELTAVLVNAIKEQQTIIDDLKSRLETLENN